MSAEQPAYDHIPEGEDRAAAECADRIHALRTAEAKPKAPKAPSKDKT